MKNKVFLSLILYAMVMPLSGQTYIQVLKSGVNIRYSPSSSSVVIAQAKKGDVFELENENGKWFEITMFSGEDRYIYKSLCQEIDYMPSLPKYEEIRKIIFLALLRAEDKAQRIADEKYPYDIDKNIDYARLLNDRYKLEVFHKTNLQPPIYYKIILEGVKKRWDR